MKEEKFLFDEGVREVLMTLFAVGATAVETGYVLKQLDKHDESPKEKAVALQIAADELQKPEFDKLADRYLDLYKMVGPNTYTNKDQSDKKVNPIKKKISQKSLAMDNTKATVRSLTTKEYADFIIPSEIVGGNLKAKVNRKFLKPYKDDKGLWTIGIGHLIGKGTTADKNKFIKKYGHSITPEQAEKIFQKQLTSKIAMAKRQFGDQWTRFSPELKKVLVDINYRGDLVDPKSSEDFNFVKLIKRGKYKDAAREYLDHKEYKKRKKKAGKDGVEKRMERNAKLIAQQI